VAVVGEPEVDVEHEVLVAVNAAIVLSGVIGALHILLQDVLRPRPVDRPKLFIAIEVRLLLDHNCKVLRVDLCCMDLLCNCLLEGLHRQDCKPEEEANDKVENYND
jgi:hypothetical protein